MYDFVVAIELTTSRVLATWKGADFRRYDERRVYQYRIAGAADRHDAERRALRIHTPA